jgi:hypothetical protein
MAELTVLSSWITILFAAARLLAGQITPAPSDFG